MGTTKASNDLSPFCINLYSILSIVANLWCVEGIVFYMLIACTMACFRLLHDGYDTEVICVYDTEPVLLYFF